MEKIIVKNLVMDMKEKLDACQFANQANQSINHYLVKLIDRVLSVLDGSTKGEHAAVIAILVDWSKAFDRQHLTLAIKSFQDNGVRGILIPILISFFEGRKMFVRWHGAKSQECQVSRVSLEGDPKALAWAYGHSCHRPIRILRIILWRTCSSLWMIRQHWRSSTL